ERLIDVNAKVLRALDVRAGGTHAEYIMTRDGRIYVVEVNARLGGGNIPNITQRAYGTGRYRPVVRVALGLTPFVDTNPNPNATVERPSAIRIIYSKDSGKLIEVKAPNESNFSFVPRMAPGTHVGEDYVGYAVGEGSTLEEAF